MSELAPLSIRNTKQTWRKLFGRLTPFLLNRTPSEGNNDSRVDEYGLPGDVPSDVPGVLPTISNTMNSVAMPWCIVGDLLLDYYRVSKTITDIEVCIPSEDLETAKNTFRDLKQFCFSFRPRLSSQYQHLAPYPRFKIKGMNLYFYLVLSSHYGLSAETLKDAIHSPQLSFPVLPLPHYVQGLANLAATSPMPYLTDQIGALIDGMDIDGDWCYQYLDGASQSFVIHESTRNAKKDGMGLLPKNEGNITKNEQERQQALNVAGRVLERKDHTLPIQIMSDLHLEYSFCCPNGENKPGYEVFECKSAAPILALIGDIGVASQDGLFIFLKRQLLKYEKIFFIMGNHEYYGGTYESAKDKLLQFSDEMQAQRRSGVDQGEFVLMDQRRYDLSDEITILGCTLWSYIPQSAANTVGSRLNDFKRISEWSVERHNQAHFSDANWLEGECNKLKTEAPKRRVIHYAPLLRGTSSSRHQNDLINTAFATDMTSRSCWGHPVTLWVFGHTHFSCDFLKKNIRVVSNPRGYDTIEASRVRFVDDLILRV